MGLSISPPRQILRRSGVERNARLTATTAAVLLFLLAAEGVTVLRIRSLLGAHIFIGALLIPPVLLKLASTGWRFLRYYLGEPGYRHKGPPLWFLRLLGPVVVLLTGLLLGSGVLLLFETGSLRSNMLFVHKASFILWFGAMTIHVLGHLSETTRLTMRDWGGAARQRLSGRGGRGLLQVVSLAAGVVLGLALVGRTSRYLASIPHFFHFH
ncbi:MAG: hypothetical protein ACYCTI_03070 [Acidimicrobiales bacterium]